VQDAGRLIARNGKNAGVREGTGFFMTSLLAIVAASPRSFTRRAAGC
jgi:hypothetical protein